MGLYIVDEQTGAMAMIARTDSDTSLFAAGSTVYTRAFSTTGGYPASVTLAAGTRYAAALIWMGTTAPGLVGSLTQSGVIGQLSPPLSTQGAGFNDLPASLTPTTSFRVYWFRLS